MKVQVRASVEVEIEVPDDWGPSFVEFYVEKNSCPGTGVVGGEIDKVIANAEEASVCWACRLRGENKIIGPPELLAALGRLNETAGY